MDQFEGGTPQPHSSHTVHQWPDDTHSTGKGSSHQELAGSKCTLDTGDTLYDSPEKQKSFGAEPPQTRVTEYLESNIGPEQATCRTESS